MTNKQQKIQAQVSAYEKAAKQLRRGLAKPKDEFVRDAAIKRFEFTFELFWKTLKEYCAFQGIECNSPRESIRGAFQLKMLSSDQKYFEMLESRNLASHTYEEQIAEQIYSRLVEFADAMDFAINTVKEQLTR